MQLSFCLFAAPASNMSTPTKREPEKLKKAVTREKKTEWTYHSSHHRHGVGNRSSRAACPHKLKCDHHKISNCHSNNRNHLQHPLAKSNRTNTFPSKMTRLLTTLIAIVLSTSAPSASALLFSPLLLASNPWGVVERHAGGASS